MNIQLGDIGHTIQLAIAPVFLLTGVGHNLVVLTNRLARIIDRSRVLEDGFRAASPHELAIIRDEYEVLRRRGHLINCAITLSTTCALLICLVIAALFVGDAFDLSLTRYIAGFFVLGMLTLIGSFSFFLREIFISIGTFARRDMSIPDPDKAKMLDQDDLP